MLSLAGPAPAKRRRLLVLSTSKKGKVQPTADQTKSIPAAKGPAADEPMQLTKFPPVDQPPMSGGGSQEVKQHSKIEAKGQRSAPGTPALAAGRCTVMVHIKSVVGTKPLLTTGTAVLSETAGQSQREQRRQGASQRTSHQSASRDVIQEERAKAMPTHFPFKASKQRPGASDDNNSQAAGVGSSASIACKQPEAATAPVLHAPLWLQVVMGPCLKQAACHVQHLEHCLHHASQLLLMTAQTPLDHQQRERQFLSPGLKANRVSSPSSLCQPVFLMMSAISLTRGRLSLVKL